MIKLITLATISLLATASLHADIKKSMYINGKVKFKRNYENGKLNGPAYAYYPNGQLKTATKFRNGKVHGMVYGYYQNGVLKAEIPMNEGKVDGYQKEFYENRQLRSVSQFKNDLNVGSKKVYFPNGNLKAKLYFNENGKLEGTAQEYYLNGNKRYAIKMENGQAKEGYVYEKNGDRKKMHAQDFDELGF